MTKQAIHIFAVLALVSSAFAVRTVAHAATLATVNGKVVSDDDLNNLIANLPAQQKEAILKNPEAKSQLVQNLIDQELMVQDAAAKKMDATKEFKDSYVAFRRQALVNILVSKQLAPKVTDAAVKEYFAKHKLRYAGDQVHAQHILLGTEKEALEVLQEAKKGADFQKLAETRSKDPSAKNNRGDLGMFGHDQFDPVFTEAAFATKVGEVSGPVKTTFGYHIIKVTERKAGKNAELAEVEQKVRADFQRELLKNYVNDLRKKAKIKQ